MGGLWEGPAGEQSLNGSGRGPFGS